MPVAGLDLVEVRGQRGDLGRLAARLISFGEFHPAQREGLVQDIGVLLLANRAHATASRAGELLGADAFKEVRGPVSLETFRSDDVVVLLDQLDDYLETASENLGLFKRPEDEKGIRDLLIAIRDASEALFKDLQRMLSVPGDSSQVEIEGYVPTSRLVEFEGRLGGYLASHEQLKKQGRYDPYVPTLLRNPRVVSVFQDLTLQKGVPNYSEIDPTPIVALVFPVFFGIMFGDLGHGLVLVAAGLVLRSRARYAYWGSLLLVLGASACTVGLLRGVAFGVQFSTPWGAGGPTSLLGSGLTAESISLILEVAVVIGAFHLTSGYALGLADRLRSGDYADALLERLPTLTMYVSAVPLGLAIVGNGISISGIFSSGADAPLLSQAGLKVTVGVLASVTAPVFVASIIVVAFGRPLFLFASTRSPGAASRATASGLVEGLARPVELFVNTVSYVRLGVLMITTTILGSLVADVLSAGVVGYILAGFLNLAIIALEGVIVYVQDMRLQLYEWFSEFYTGSGRPFVPLVSGGPSFSLAFS